MADFYWRDIVLLSPTIGDPDVFDITRSPALYQFITTVSCPFEQTFQDGPHIFRPCFSCSGFVLSVLLLSSTPATVSPISPRIVPHFRVYCENSTGFDVNNIAVRFVSHCCVVVELHSSHSFRQFFRFQVLSSSISSFASYCQYCVVVEFTPATVTPSPTPTPTPTLGHIFCSF